MKKSSFYPLTNEDSLLYCKQRFGEKRIISVNERRKMSLKSQKTDAWSLYHAMFKNGEEVVLVLENDEFTWGKIVKTTADYLTLKSLTDKEEKIHWDDVRFMAHDGFPVRQIFGADGSHLIEQVDTKDIQKAIRQIFSAKPYSHCDKPAISLDSFKHCPKCVKEGFSSDAYLALKRCREQSAGITIGHPYELRAAKGLLVNSGKIWTPTNYEYEETLLLESKDGARAMLWDLSTCYHFET